MTKNNIKILFLWHGLPAYALRCIKHVEKLFPDITVVGVRPSVPFTGLDEIISKEIIWLDEDKNYELLNILGKDYDLCIVSGYFYKPFMKYVKETYHSVKHILCSDNNFFNIKSFKYRLIAPLFHKFYLSKYFYAAFTPGYSGAKYLNHMGYKNVYQGLYGSSSEIFYFDKNLHKKEKTISFVGQLVERKNIIKVCKIFLQLEKKYPSWKFNIYGSGRQKNDLEKIILNSKNISLNKFKQPHEIARILRKSSALILPSRVEHWGLVVHEAALSGCALLLSNNVGSIDDLSLPTNSSLFNPNDNHEIKSSLEWLFNLSDESLKLAATESIRLSKNFGGESFCKSIERIVNEI